MCVLGRRCYKLKHFKHFITLNTVEENMRFLFTVIFLILTSLILISCESSVEPLFPNDDSGITNLKKLDSFNYSPIELPQRSPLYKDSVYSVSAEVDGSVGGRIDYENYYVSEDGDSISFYIDLFIPPMAFEGIRTITATFDSVYAAIHFTPSMEFDSALHLFQGFKGLDLSDYQTGTFDFVYTRDDGTTELISKTGTQVIVPQGLVRVMNAQLEHFSRYGWVRKCAAPKVIYDTHDCY
jgi:hypothetical protein